MTEGRTAGHGVGLVGCGGFGSFVAGVLGGTPVGPGGPAGPGIPGAQLIATTDTEPAAARDLANRFPGVRTERDVDHLVAGEDIDVIVVATPPWTHADLAVRALDAGCHVLVEKPLAIDLAGCRRVATAALANDRVVAVDHMLRFAPLVLALERLLYVEAAGQRVLGPVRRFSFENDAADEGLPPEHWFWDQTRSGGIFVEHGVHFFDLASSLIGSEPATIQATALSIRPGRPCDTVCATATYAAGASATWYHSFSHPRRGERQRLRLDLGSAECQLDGWIPLELRLEAWAEPEGAAALGAALAVDEHRDLGIPTRELSVEPGRVRLRLAHDGADAKPKVYAQCVASVITDLVDAIDHGRRPRIGTDEATSAVALAVAATEAAASGATTALPSM